MNAFTHVTSARSYLVSTDGKLSMSYTDEEFKEGIKYIRKLVEDGLLDATSFAQSTEVMQSAVIGTGEVVVGGFAAMSDSWIPTEHQTRGKWQTIPPLTGPKGYASVACNPELPTRTAYITEYCEHPEVAFRLMDLMCREDFTITSRWGKQGVNWDYVADLKEEDMEALATANNKNGETVEYDWENTLYAGYPPYFYEYDSAWVGIQNVHWRNAAVKFRTGEITGGYNAATQRVDEAYLSNPTNVYNGTHFMNDFARLKPKEVIGTILYPDADTTIEATEILAELGDYVVEKLSGWFVGSSDVETDWDAYLAELENIGLSRYLELAQVRWGK